MTPARPLAVTAADGVALEAEWIAPGPGARSAVLCCHPHPQYGGTMHAPLVDAVFRGVAATGRAVARFNFRGAGRSAGAFTDGDGERLDATAALEALASAVTADGSPGVPVVVVGWSFGADLALSLRDPRVAGWALVAPPLHWVDDPAAAGRDPRPALVVVGERDDLVGPDRLAATTATWRSTTLVRLPGADHFFATGVDRVVDLVRAFCDRVEAEPQSARKP